jgi:hypothetical protein
MSKFIPEMLKKRPLLLKYCIILIVIFIFCTFIELNELYSNRFLSDRFLIDCIFDYIFELRFIPPLLISTYFTASLAISHTLFKWLSISKNEPQFQNSKSITATDDANITIVHGNYDSLNQDILNLIKNNAENGYELELLDYILKYRNRLLNHIQSLTKNSALNLIIGLMTTIVGVIVLYGIFIESGKLDVLGYFSRISIAIFIELSSFFFLRLYSSNLFEIKYFHNELSNIDAKMIALKVALLKKDDDTLKFILKELMKTERNRLLKKGETTVELEKMRFDREESKSLTDTLTKVVEPLLKSLKKDSKDDKE